MATSDSSPIFPKRIETKKFESVRQDSSSSDSDNRSKRGKKFSSKMVAIAGKLASASRAHGDSPSHVMGGMAPAASSDRRAPQEPNATLVPNTVQVSQQSIPIVPGSNGVLQDEKAKSKKSRKKSTSSSSSSSLSEDLSSSSAQSGHRSNKRKKRSKKSKRASRYCSSSSSSTSNSSYQSDLSSDEDCSSRKKFTLSRDRTKQLLGYLTRSFKTDELKNLRKDYVPKFDSKHFDLKRPKLDRQVRRRIKRVRSYDAARAVAKEKNLANIQFKVLDVFRPLLYAWALICTGEASEEHPLQAAVVCAMKLLGHCFNYLSGQRRSNILKVTDPEYEDVANDEALFNKKEFSHLFGQKFLRNLAKEVAVDNEMERAMGRPGSSHNPSYRTSKRVFKRNGDRGGFSFGHGGPNFKKDASGSSRGGRRLVTSICFNPATSATPFGMLFGGRISNFLNFWRSITADAWVLSAIESGVSLPFLQTPSSGFRHRNLVFGSSTRVCEDEVTVLLMKGAIEEIRELDAKFVSGIFVIPKSNGGYRMIINLKPINKFIKHFHFKMENLALLRDLVQRGDFFTKIDLTDAYLSVPLHKLDRKFLQFSWNSKFYQFRTLCFWAFYRTLGVHKNFKADYSLFKTVRTSVNRLPRRYIDN